MAGRRILVVDDEPNVLGALIRLLVRRGFEVESASCAEEGFVKMRTEPAQVVVSDHDMPGVKGLEFLRLLKDEFPETVSILLTGVADKELAIQATNEGVVFRFVEKPWDNEYLVACVRQAFAEHDLIVQNRQLVESIMEHNETLRRLNESLEARVEERTAELLERKAELQDLSLRLERERVATRKGLLRVVSNILLLLDQRDGFTGSHSARVAAAAYRLGIVLGMDEEEARLCRLAGMFHDAGKIGMSDEVLIRDPRSLIGAERQVYEQHPVAGESCLISVDLVSPAAAMVRSHHEKFSGGGFPDGLSKEEIPLGARIIAVCDAYDRVLNMAGTGTPEPELAHDRLARGAGVDFDPEVVEAALSVFYRKNTSHRLTEVPVHVRDLRENMVLARDIVAASGAVMARGGEILAVSDVERLGALAATGSVPVVARIYRRIEEWSAESGGLDG